MDKKHLWEDLSGEYPIRICTSDAIVKNGTEFNRVDIEDGTYYYNTYVDYSDLAILETETKTRVDYNRSEKIIEINRNVTLEPYVWPVTLKGITTEEFLNDGFTAAEIIKIKNAIGTQSMFTSICDDPSGIYTALGVPPGDYGITWDIFDDTPAVIASEHLE